MTQRLKTKSNVDYRIRSIKLEADVLMRLSGESFDDIKGPIEKFLSEEFKDFLERECEMTYEVKYKPPLYSNYNGDLECSVKINMRKR